MDMNEVHIDIGNESISVGKEPKSFTRKTNRKIGTSNDGKKIMLSLWHNSKDEVIYTNIYKE